MNKKKQVAIITGGAKRIGAAICRRLHKANIDIIIHYKSSDKEASSLKDELNGIRKDSASMIQADLLDSNNYPLIINEAINTFGQLNFLINNASSYYPPVLMRLMNQIGMTLLGAILKLPFSYLKKLHLF